MTRIAIVFLVLLAGCDMRSPQERCMDMCKSSGAHAAVYKSGWNGARCECEPKSVPSSPCGGEA